MQTAHLPPNSLYSSTPPAQFQALCTSSSAFSAYLSFKHHTKASHSTSPAMEEAQLAAWATMEGYEELPLDPISCPLSHDDRKKPYSLAKVAGHAYEGEWVGKTTVKGRRRTFNGCRFSCLPHHICSASPPLVFIHPLASPPTADGHLYKSQEEALETFFLNPPINKTSTRPGKRNRLKPNGTTTLKTKKKEIGQFVGFCVLWMGLEPTMEHLMSPILVAKYVGFMIAKGLSTSTIKKASCERCLGVCWDEEWGWG